MESSSLIIHQGEVLLIFMLGLNSFQKIEKLYSGCILSHKFLSRFIYPMLLSLQALSILNHWYNHNLYDNLVKTWSKQRNKRYSYIPKLKISTTSVKLQW